MCAGTSCISVKSSRPGGGFVFQQVHNILANVPPENLIAMYDAVREYDSARQRASGTLILP